MKIYLQTTPKEQTCPSCGLSTKRIHDYRTQTIKDLPFKKKIAIWFSRNDDIDALAENDSLKSMTFLNVFHMVYETLIVFGREFYTLVTK